MINSNLILIEALALIFYSNRITDIKYYIQTSQYIINQNVKI